MWPVKTWASVVLPPALVPLVSVRVLPRLAVRPGNFGGCEEGDLGLPRTLSS